MLLLVPSDPLSPRQPDEHFAAEADAASALGFDVALVDHDAVQARDSAGVLRRLGDGGDGGHAVYRGWMVRSEEYAWLEGQLASRDVSPRTTAGAYRRAHELPGWYEAFKALTPLSVEVTDTTPLDQALAALS